MTSPSPSPSATWGFDPLKLDAYLRAAVSGVEGEMSLEPICGGQSNPTFFVTYPSRRNVLRKQPSGPVLASAHAVYREHRIMDALASTGVPVPRMAGTLARPAAPLKRSMAQTERRAKAIGQSPS